MSAPMLNAIVRGKLDGPTVFFLHGWPDTELVFNKTTPLLESSYRVVLLQLPLYTKQSPTGGSSSTGNAPLSFFGYTLEEVRDMLIRTVVALQGSEGPGYMVCHDWGAIVTYQALQKEPQLFKKLVALDIGQHYKIKGLKATLMILWYQWTLMFAYILPSFLGSWVTRSVAKLFQAPNPPLAHSGMNYLYCRVWQKLLTGNGASIGKWAPPAIPVLYLYGIHKPFFFHSQRWLDHLEQAPGSAVVALEGGHWFFRNSKSAARANEAIQKFLS